MKKNKYDSLDALTDMCKISLEIIEKNSQKDILIDKSAKRRIEIIENTLKQFLTPIDREDIVMLSLMIHRLNISLYKLNFDIDNIKTAAQPLSDMINLISNMFESKFRIPPQKFAEKFDSLYLPLKNKYTEYDNIRSGVTFDTKGLIKQNIFDRINRCFDQLGLISDQIITTIVKNT